MKTQVFLQEFEVLLKQLQSKKGISTKKRSLTRRMVENPIFHLNEKQMKNLAPHNKDALSLLFEKLHTFV
jgi:predicted transcriptional regulator YheO